jgi:hypothetical protein
MLRIDRCRPQPNREMDTEPHPYQGNCLLQMLDQAPATAEIMLELGKITKL